MFLFVLTKDAIDRFRRTDTYPNQDERGDAPQKKLFFRILSPTRKFPSRGSGGKAHRVYEYILHVKTAGQARQLQ